MRIRVIVAYFGAAPEWLTYTLRSMEMNPCVDWLLVADFPYENEIPSNVEHRLTTWDAYRRHVSDALCVDCSAVTPYKLCDLRPMLGVIHQPDIVGYEYFGWCDLDVIFGDLTKFLSAALPDHHVFSTHPERLSGHFALLQNSSILRTLFTRHANWTDMAATPEYVAFDEYPFFSLILESARDFPWLKIWAHEQYSTVDAHRPWRDGTRRYPSAWRWRRGILTVDGRDDLESMYLHFMNWKSNRWRAAGTAPWLERRRIAQPVPLRDLNEFVISTSGIYVDSDWTTPAS